MRRLVWLLAACGAAAPPPATPIVTKAPTPRRPLTVWGVADPFAALSYPGSASVSWIVPGPARLEIGGGSFDAPVGAAATQVALVEQQGNMIRLAVRLEHVRFLIWSDRDRLLAMLAHDQHVSQYAGGDFVDLAHGEPIQVVLRSGARVRRLAHKNGWTQVRYFGAIEIDGWVPDDVLVDRGDPRDGAGRLASGRQTLMLMHGAVIRTEPKWSARELAVMANGYFVDTVRKLDDAWSEVAYADGDVILHGFVSQQDPPGQLHRPRTPDTPIAAQPNTLAPSGTCLYAREGGDVVGYVVGDHDVELADGAHPGWWSVTVDTPWGATTFAAKGPMKTELFACAPPGSVPKPAPP